MLFSVPDLTVDVIVLISVLTVLICASIDLFSFLAYVDVDLDDFVLCIFDRFSNRSSFSFDISRKFRFLNGDVAFNLFELLTVTTEFAVDLSFGNLRSRERAVSTSRYESEEKGDNR